MQFTLMLPIARSRGEVWRAFDNAENLKLWQPGLMKLEDISGRPGHPGAIAKLTYLEGKREYALMERVTYREEPDRLDHLYENNYADNTIKNTFIATSAAETLWKMEVAFKFKTLLMRIVGPFAQKNLIKRSEADMNRFKALVEGTKGSSSR